MVPLEIKTIKSAPETTLKERGSVFIANSFPAGTVEEVNFHLKDVKKKYFDASHHCYAYKFSDGTYKFSDDGEPSGTAGLRILNAIDHFDLINIVAAVTRYFGGTKLGVGPLGKAYYSVAESSLKSSEIITLSSYLKVTILVDFDYINQVHKYLNDTKSKISKTEYLEKIHFECFIKPESADLVKNRIIEATRGSAEIMIEKEYYLI